MSLKYLKNLKILSMNPEQSYYTGFLRSCQPPLTNPVKWSILLQEIMDWIMGYGKKENRKLCE